MRAGKAKPNEPTIEISVQWAGKPPEGVPSKVVLTKKHFEALPGLIEKPKKSEHSVCPYGFEEQGGHCGACGIDDCPFSDEDDSPDSLQGGDVK
jgi:hypothetical protein